MLNLNQLYYFFVTARAGAVTSAAKQLRISQPSLSAQIKTLESTIGKKLFVRAGRGVRLSRDGEFLYGQCRSIFEAAESLEATLKGASESQRLSLGVSPEVERPFLVDMVGQIHREATSKVKPAISMSSLPHENLLAQVRTRVLDAAILNEPVFDPELAMIESARMPVVLAFRNDGRHKKLRSVPPAALKPALREFNYSWALPARGMRLRQETDQFLERLRIDVPVAFESDVLATIARAVIDDIGIAMLPLQYIKSYAFGKAMGWITPPKGFWQHGLWLISRKAESDAARLSPLKRAFHDVLNSKSVGFV